MKKIALLKLALSSKDSILLDYGVNNFLRNMDPYASKFTNNVNKLYEKMHSLDIVPQKFFSTHGDAMDSLIEQFHNIPEAMQAMTNKANRLPAL